MAEIGKVLERRVAARRNNALDRLAADAAQSRERIEDRIVGDFEFHRRTVDRWRLDLDAEPLGLGAEFGELVGIAHVERHRRGEELDRIIRLHIGGLIGEQRIGRRVRLVESVFGEFCAGIEDGFGIGAPDAALDRAGDETVALRRHLLAIFLAHGAAQNIGFAETIAGQIAGDLLHLLLIGDDAVGRLQDRLELRMQVVGALVTELSRAIGRNIRHRPRADRAPPARSGPRSGRGACRSARGACPDFPPGTRRPFRRAPAFRRSWCRRAAGSTDRCRCRAARTSFTARSSTVSVLRPRKSNFTRPAGSTHFMLNCVTGISDFGSR